MPSFGSPVPQPPAPSKAKRSNRLPILRCLVIWFVAAVLSGSMFVAGYTAFLGRGLTVRNDSIYEGHRFVGKPGTTRLSSLEGYGRTSFGKNGLVVDKALDSTSRRVLFVGDSLVSARQVSDSSKFTEIVERVWNEKHPDKRILSLNLGLAGQSNQTYISFGRNMDRVFRPDLVFVMSNYDDFRQLAE
jgi:hypothetical protein